LSELKKKFDIQVINIDPALDAPQMKSYRYSYENFGDEVDWMAFIDGDEFLFSPNHDTMDEALKQYVEDKISAIGVYWACFGSSGHLKEPQGFDY
jgi:hypothetical protein